MSDSILPASDEHLTDGWEPDLPATDSLVRQAVLAHASWPIAVAISSGRPWHRDDDWSGAWLGDRGEFTNMVMPTRPPRDPGALVAGFNALVPAHASYVLFDAWQTDLSPYGLRLLGHPPVMVRFPGPPPATSGRAADVREVITADELATAERIVVEGYPLPDVQPLSRGDVFGTTILEGPTRLWLGFLDDEPVSVAVAHHDSGVVLVQYVATLPQARGRGLGAAVTWAATLSEPESPAMLVASDDGRPVYERMGYHAIERWSAWLRLAV
ncbi:MAG: hypothetical protein WBV37_17810 [Nocardioidaceae bacterium]